MIRTEAGAPGVSTGNWLEATSRSAMTSLPATGRHRGPQQAGTPRTGSKPTIFLLLLLTACVTTSERRSSAIRSGARAPTAEVRYLMLEGHHSCEDQQEGPVMAMAKAISEKRSTLENALGVTIRRLRNRPELQAALGETDARPLVLVYVGYGRSLEARSELCLSDGPLVVNDALGWIHGGVPYAVLILDGCETADVDVSLSPVPTSVLSASPLPIDTDSSDRTGLGTLLPDALAPGDTNRDGWVDDRELLDSLQAGKRESGNALLPRLRRQAWSPLPVFAVGAARLPSIQSTPCVEWGTGSERPSPGNMEPDLLKEDWGLLQRSSARARGSSCEGFSIVRRGAQLVLFRMRDLEELLAFPPEELATVVGRVRDGHWATVTEDSSGWFLWHGGQVGDPIITLDGREFSKADRVPVWCRGQSFGQCFQVTEMGVDLRGDP